MNLLLTLLAAMTVKSAADNCMTLSKTNAQVERTVKNVGLHREVETQVWVSSTEFPLEDCVVVVKEDLPPGVYVDPEELRRLQSSNAVPPYIVGTTVDIEVGEWAAQSIPLLYFPILTRQVNSKTGDVSWYRNFTTPLHIRYHRPRSSTRYGSTADVTVLHPSMLLNCPSFPSSCITQLTPLLCPPPLDGATVLSWTKVPHNQLVGLDPRQPPAKDYPLVYASLPSCAWLPLHSFSTSDSVSMSIPVGDTDQLDLVLFVTTAVTSAATLLLLTPLLRQYKRSLRASPASGLHHQPAPPR